jgi:voltage-gated potassium channel
MNHQAYTERNRPWISPLLLGLTIFSLFAMPFFPESWHHSLYAVFFSLIFLCAAYLVRGDRPLLFPISLVIVLVTDISPFLAEGSFISVTRFLQFVFFVLLVIALIRQIAASPDVSGMVIMDAVTAYLLLGIASGMMVILSNTLVKDAYSDPLLLQTGDTNGPDIRDAMYYAFATFTTTGYGDITARHPVTKALSTLIAICGQLYVTIILAMLVGKFASRKPEPTKKK